MSGERGSFSLRMVGLVASLLHVFSNAIKITSKGKKKTERAKTRDDVPMVQPRGIM